MPTINSFTKKFADSILSVLECHDRVIFKGYLPFFKNGDLHRLCDSGLGMRRKDFVPFLEGLSEELVEHGKRVAAEAGAPYRFLQGEHTKEQIIREEIAKRSLKEGLVAVLCCMETGRGVKLRPGKDRPELYFTSRPQRVVYFYSLDPEFGLIHVRIQTFFPYSVQVYVNGHDWLARQMNEKQIGFLQSDNAFVQLDNPEAAQRLADRFAHLNWIKILDRWVRRANPLLKKDWLNRCQYYWVIDRAEYSTDVLFRSREDLQALYPRLVDHSIQQFSADDLMKFLGRKLYPQFDGEILTLGRKKRAPGTRVKHRMKGNWLKMYDKFERILRIETVINQPGEFHVRRRCIRKGVEKMAWCPMNKGVSNFYRYLEVARASNRRYLEALAVVDAPSVTVRQLDQLSQPVSLGNRKRRGLNLMHAEEQKLFLAVLCGDNRINGFRNHDILKALNEPARDAAERRRQTQRVSRQLGRLRAHGLIRKVPRAHRYHVTDKGNAVMAAAVRIRIKEFPKELKTAI
ncbi:hypothetical protein KIH39_07880 [Telmatocola sphagniphila]|uniref:Uncharacterized protein n=1 Tax=Telmatocola sphagniphila TaxID=1123043 RepID=A0A8E6EUK2_9BACT|nr:hypothetical protein [Telmatocola sphagniphila]QVL33814.1 hypothetical protein KIH39_07880 [Telmatocola sphagniphila]